MNRTKIHKTKGRNSKITNRIKTLMNSCINKTNLRMIK